MYYRSASFPLWARVAGRCGSPHSVWPGLNPVNVVNILKQEVEKSFSKITVEGIQDKSFANELLEIIKEKYICEISLAVCCTLDIESNSANE